jgi:hypothetical protein
MANLSDIIAAGGAPTISATAVVFTDVIDNNSSTTKHGYLPKLSGVATNALKGDGTWADVASGGGGTILFPFYTSAGVLDTISLLSGTMLPFYDAAGTAKNIQLTIA